MRRFVRVAVTACVLVTGIAKYCYAQQQTWFKVTDESITTSVTLPAGITYRLGTGDCHGAAAWQQATTSAALTLDPVSMGGPNQFPFSDPCPNVAKELDVLETATAQTVMVATSGAAAMPLQVPGTAPAVSAACSQVLPPEESPQTPAAPLECPLMANAVAVGTDGMVLVDAEVAAPVVLQYCQGTVCNQPFTFTRLPLLIGANVGCGGPTGGSGAGMLYVIEGARPVTLYLTPDGSTKTVQVAAIATPTT